MVAGGMRGCGGHAWLWGGVCGCRGVCMVAGGHVWLLGACVVVGGMCGCVGCAWLQEGMCMVAGGVCGWGGMCGCRGACVVAGLGVHGCGGGMHRIQRDTLNERAVRILLECSLVRILTTQDAKD